MPRPRPPHLHHEVTRHGKVAWYVRMGKGPRIRIKGVYGSPEFDDAYQDAINGKKPTLPGKAARGTLEWLWNLYRGNAAWTDLSLATRRQRENIMRPVLASAGKDPLSKVTKRSVEKGVEKRKATPTQAKHFVTSLRGMFEWAIASDVVKVDPTHGIGFKTSKKAAKSAGFPVWTDDELARFEHRWPRGTRERVLFDIYLYTGLRRGDAALLGKQHVKNGVITIVTEKTGMQVTIPILPELQATLDAGPLGELNFVARINRQPMTKESVGNFFADACRAAGIKKSGHGIRKAAATNMADNEATTAQMNSIFGWEGDAMASLYTKSANRKRLAASAVGKLSRTKTETAIPAPEQKVRGAGEKDQ